jgi:hypothetical protein
MSDSECVDSAAVAAWKQRLLEHLRKRPRDNIQLGDLRKDRALAIAAMQLVKEQAPRMVLLDFGDSMTLSMQITVDRLSPESLNRMREEQLILDAEALHLLGDELPDAPGNPGVAADEGSAD